MLDIRSISGKGPTQNAGWVCQNPTDEMESAKALRGQGRWTE